MTDHVLLKFLHVLGATICSAPASASRSSCWRIGLTGVLLALESGTPPTERSIALSVLLSLVAGAAGFPSC